MTYKYAQLTNKLYNNQNKKNNSQNVGRVCLFVCLVYCQERLSITQQNKNSLSKLSKLSKLSSLSHLSIYIIYNTRLHI